MLRVTLAGIALLTVLGGTPAQGLRQVGHLRLAEQGFLNGPGYEIVPVNDDKHLIVFGHFGPANGAAVKVVRVSDFKVVGGANAEKGTFDKWVGQGAFGPVLVDAGRRRVAVPTAETILNFPTDAKALDALPGNYPATVEVEVGEGKPPADTVWRHTGYVRSKAGLEKVTLTARQSQGVVVRKAPAAAAADERVLELFDLPKPGAGDFRLTRLQVSEDGRLAVCGFDGAQFTRPGPGAVVLAGEQGKCCLATIDLSRMELLGGANLTCHAVQSVAIARDGAFCVCGSQDGSVEVVDLKRHRPVGPPIPASNWTVARLWIDPADKVALAMCWVSSRYQDANFHLIDLGARRVVRSATAGSSLGTISLDSRAERLFTLSRRGELQAWDVKSFLAGETRK